MKSRIVQIELSSDTEGDYAKLVALTNTGEIYLAVLSPGIVKGDEDNWRKLKPPTDLTQTTT